MSHIKKRVANSGKAHPVLIVVIVAAVVLMLPIVLARFKGGTGPASSGGDDLDAKVARLNVGSSNLDEVIRVLGEPLEYVWGDQKYTRNNLPSMYCVSYPDRFLVVMNNGRIEELRFHTPGYMFDGALQVGSALDDVLQAVGQPTNTVQGQPNGWQDGVLYKDIDGRTGYCYYQRPDKGVRFFFSDYKVSALYVTGS